jgi:flagellar biosynthetic protein FlhB
MADSADKDSKTEEATPKKLGEARLDGTVPMSSEFTAAIALITGLAFLNSQGNALLENVGQSATALIESLGTTGIAEWDKDMGAEIMTTTLSSVFFPLMMVALPAIGISIVIGYLQVGFKITPKAIAVKWSKLDPIAGSKKLVSMRSFVRTSMSALKLVAITSVVLVVAYYQIANIIQVSDSDLRSILQAVSVVLLRCAIAALVVIFILSFIDLIYQRYQHAKDLMMSKQEIKDEVKQQDGDPHLKARIRRTQQEMSTRRMMDDVPNATVVITNPTHFAVALRYEQGAESSRAPVVVAKGMDSLAQRIKAVAKENKVITYEDVPLARALYARAEVGEEIPEDLFSAVAVVLGYVYRLRAGAAQPTAGI